MKKTKLLKTLGCIALVAAPIIVTPIIMSTSCSIDEPIEPPKPEINDPTPIELLVLKKIGTWSNGENQSLTFDIFIDEKASENDPNVLRFAKLGCEIVPGIMPEAIGWTCFGVNVEKSQNDWKNVVKSETISIPNQARTNNLGDNAEFINSIAYFEGSNSLKAIDIPVSVRHINENCFENCINLQKIVLTSGTFNLHDNTAKDLFINSYAFAGCKSLMQIKFSHEKLLNSIGSFSFFDCVNLSGELIIPSSPLGTSSNTSIYEKAFANCIKLTGVTIPKSVTSIDVSAFSGCKLTSLTFYAETAEDAINFQAFESMLDSIKVINVPDEASIQSYIDAFATDGVTVERSLFHPLN